LKLVVNMIMGSMMGAFAEGLALAQGADLPLDALLQVGCRHYSSGKCCSVISCTICRMR
jgi:3-hydroxyisobutyrate dehydrogenase-like beta-hydroxyacid dehydrogenase